MMSIGPEKYYINVGRATDLKKPKERRVYRALEILPGALVWTTLIGMFLLSWLKPVWVAYFIIAFSVYWLLRTFHFSLHIISAYQKMKVYLKTDWIEKLDKLAENNPDKDWHKIYHLIIFPMYKESLAVIEGSFEALLNVRYPKEKMIVVLAIEERAGQIAQEVVQAISKKYQDEFLRFLVTEHPKNINGEIAGKGSNESWAGKQAQKIIIDPLKIPYEDVIVSSFDADAQVYPQYFSCLTYHYLTSAHPTRSSFQPIPVYFNNFAQAPFFSRIVSSCNFFWQMMQQQRPEKITTYSSHSMNFKTLIEMDFWQANVVSEDAGVFWKAFLFYDGAYQIIPIHYPLSMDACVGKTFWQTALNQYKQQRRWAWGSEGIPYLLFGFLKNKKIPFHKKFRYSFLMIESFWAWGTNALLILFLGWLPLLLGGGEFNATILSYNLPQMVRNLMTLALVGVFMSVIINTLLVSANFSWRSKWQIFFITLQWVFLPVSLIIFGALPAIDAQTRLMLGKYMGFWVTEKVRK